MEAALRPHRGGTVLALGILSVVIPLVVIAFAVAHSRIGQLFMPLGIVIVPLGLVAGVLGWKQIAGMKALRIDPTGRSLARTGQILGVVGAGAWAAFTVIGLYQVSRLFTGDYTMTIPFADGTLRMVRTYRAGELESEDNEAHRPDGTWMKEGSSTRWSHTANGIQHEQGFYRDGKRNGEWTFWNEDGSIDKERSGLYQNDARIGPSPVGDFPGDEIR